jgi:hypothetical protein
MWSRISLERHLEWCTHQVELWYADNNAVPAEVVGYCKAGIEFIPTILTLMKIEEKRKTDIQTDDLWKEIDRLHDEIDKLKPDEYDLQQAYYNSIDIKDTHDVKPDPRLVFEDKY